MIQDSQVDNLPVKRERDDKSRGGKLSSIISYDLWEEPTFQKVQKKKRLLLVRFSVEKFKTICKKKQIWGAICRGTLAKEGFQTEGM